MPLKAPRWIYWKDWGGYILPYITAEELWPWVVLSSLNLQSCGTHLWTVWFLFTWHTNLHLDRFELLVLWLVSLLLWLWARPVCSWCFFLQTPICCVTSPGKELILHVHLGYVYVQQCGPAKRWPWTSCTLTRTANIAQITSPNSLQFDLKINLSLGVQQNGLPGLPYELGFTNSTLQASLLVVEEGSLYGSGLCGITCITWIQLSNGERLDWYVTQVSFSLQLLHRAYALLCCTTPKLLLRY